MRIYLLIEPHDSVYTASQVTNRAVEEVLAQLSAKWYPVTAPKNLKYCPLPPEAVSPSDW